MSVKASAIPVVVPPGKGEVLVPGRAVLRISGQQTGDAFEILELGGPEGDGPPPHIHVDRNELFYVLQGTVEFTVGHQTIAAEAGSLIFVPRNTRHGFKLGPETKLLGLVAPAGLEGFFRELGAGMAAGKSHMEIREGLEPKYDQHPVE